MRVLQVCPYDWHRPGGVQVHVGQLASDLRRRGHDVLVVAAGRAELSEPGVRLIGRSLPVRCNGAVGQFGCSPQAAWALRDIVRDYAPDVVHAHEPLVPGASMLATLLSPAPVVATFHAYCESAVSTRLYGALAALSFPVRRRLARCIAVSEAAARYVEPCIRQRAEIIPNGIDVERYKKPRINGHGPRRQLLFVGRLDPRKGFSVAVDAFALLARRHQGLTMAVVGDGRERSALGRAPVEIRSRVTMRGSMRNDALPDVYRHADVFVAPSLGCESFGIILLEAMAAGVPVVAADIPGYREVVRNGRDGLLVRPNDSQALADAVRRIIEDQALADTLGQAGRSRASEFAWPVVAARIEEAYAGVLNRNVECKM